MGLAIDATMITSQEDEIFGVWRDNDAAFRAFLGLETQWVAVASLSGLIWIGLNYQAVDIVMRRYQSPDHVFEDLQDMEREALRVFGEER